MDDFESLGIALVEMRNCNEVFEDIYSKTKLMCDQFENEVPSLKKRKVSVILENMASTSSKTDSAVFVENKKYELRLLTNYPLLDSLVERLSQESKNVIPATDKQIILNLISNINMCRITDLSFSR